MKKIIFLSIGMFALGLDAYVIAGILPNIGMTYKTSIAENAQAITIFTLCYAISAPIFSSLVAGKSIRKILTLALVIFCCANVVSALSPNLHLFLISRAFAGLGAGLFSPTAAAAAVTLVPATQKGRALSIILGGMSAGTVIGVPVGMYLAFYLGWSFTLWFVTIIGGIGLIGILIGLPTIVVMSPPSLVERIKELSNIQVAATISVTLLTAIASLGLYSFISLIVKEIYHVDNILPYLWVWGIGGMIGSFSIGHLIDFYKKPRVILVIILGLMICSFICIPLLYRMSAILTLLPVFIWGATGWSSLAPQQHTLLELQPEHGATVVALNSSSNYLGSSLGTFLGSFLLTNNIQINYFPYFAAIIIGIALSIQIIICFRTKTNE